MGKPFRYQEEPHFFAQIAHHLEDEGVSELLELGALSATASYRGVRFAADPGTLYGIVYGTRLCTRVLAPLIRFDCHSDRYLYKTAAAIAWNELFTVSETFAVTATVSHSRIRHSKFAALRLKDAIVDFFRETTGERPSVDRTDPEILFHLHIENNKATIYLDVGGGSLHRRGYRRESVEAPMQETVAAAIIRYSDWDGERALYDPMCGSGTLLAEALMHVCRIPAAYLRPRFGFEKLPDFDFNTWKRIKEERDALIRPIPETGALAGSDVHSGAIRAARVNLAQLPHGDQIELSQRDLFRLDGLPEQTIITNPPYGLRLGKRDQIDSFYTEFGNFLKRRCNGSTCFLYAGKKDLLKHVGLRATWKKPIVSGALDGRLARYEMY